MNWQRLILAGLFLMAASAFAGMRMMVPLQAQIPPPAGKQQVPPPTTKQIENPIVIPARGESPEAGIKKLTDDYTKAFNARDAKAASSFWTEEGEYIGTDGEAIRTRAAIEKSLADDFKAQPKATIEVQVDSVRAMGRQTALAQGVVRLKTTPDSEPIETHYSALHVLEDGKWHVATVREWQTSPGQNAAFKHLEWLVGQWTGKGSAGTISISYAWDENKTFLLGKYSISKDGKTTSSGTQTIGRNAAGGLRSWMFDSTGTYNTGYWQREGNRWVEETIGVLPDGTEVDSVNVMIPLGKDAFTWQTTEHSAGGVALPPLPPIKVTRANAAK